MNLVITIPDIIALVAVSDHFKTAVEAEVKKQTQHLQGDIMALKDQIAALNDALTAQGEAITKEFGEVKAKLEAVKKELNDKIAVLEAKVAELEGTDLSVEIQALKDSVAKIDAISESDVPAPEPTV